MRTIDARFKPVPAATKNMRIEPSTLRVYESSIEDCLSFVMSDFGMTSTATRLDLSQTETLYELLGEYLGIDDRVEQAYEAGCIATYETAYETGYAAGRDNGYMAGYADSAEHSLDEASA